MRVQLDWLAVGAGSPALPLGNAGANWWLKLTQVLRGHEISFIPSLYMQLGSLEEKTYLHCTEPFGMTYAIPPQPLKLRNSIRVLLLIWCG